MRAVELLHQKIDDLPESAYLSLLEYVEFLLHKHQIEPSQDSEVKHLTQELIAKRYEAYRQNRSQESKSLAEWDSEIKAKYGWNE